MFAPLRWNQRCEIKLTVSGGQGIAHLPAQLPEAGQDYFSEERSSSCGFTSLISIGALGQAVLLGI